MPKGMCVVHYLSRYGLGRSSSLTASARCVSPSASVFVFGFSVLRATSRNLFAADVAHMAALLPDEVMRRR